MDVPFFDLYKEMTTNPAFVEKVNGEYRAMIEADRKGDAPVFREHALALLRMCDFNASLFVPFFFPKYPEDQPMTFWSRPHAFALFAYGMPGSYQVIQASRQVGKCVSGDTTLRVLDRGEEKEMSLQTLFEDAAHASRTGSHTEP